MLRHVYHLQTKKMIYVVTFGQFGGTFYVMNAQMLAISAGLRSNFYMPVSQK